MMHFAQLSPVVSYMLYLIGHGKMAYEEQSQEMYLLPIWFELPCISLTLTTVYACAAAKRAQPGHA